MSGKTTLWRDLRGVLQPGVQVDVTFVKDEARSALEDIGVSLPERDRLGFQHYVGYRQILIERRVSNHAAVVLDKSVIDARAYWRVFVNERDPAWASPKIAGRYDVVFLCDHTTIEPSGSGAIDTMHERFRDQLAAEIRSSAGLFSKHFIDLTGSRESRLAAALDVLKRSGENLFGHVDR